MITLVHAGGRGSPKNHLPYAQLSKDELLDLAHVYMYRMLKSEDDG